jgi:hypothetical protein
MPRIICGDNDERRQVRPAGNQPRRYSPLPLTIADTSEQERGPRRFMLPDIGSWRVPDTNPQSSAVARTLVTSAADPAHRYASHDRNTLSEFCDERELAAWPTLVLTSHGRRSCDPRSAFV